MFSNTFTSRIAQRLIFHNISHRVFLAMELVGSCAIFLYSRYGALRLCYVSRTDERGRNGRGTLASEGRNASNVRLFTRVSARAREPTHDTSHASSIMEFY